jgi:outer membrane immunogenic protein
MKRMLIVGALTLAAAGQALAADLPQPGAPPPPRAPAMYVPTMAPVYNWGGVYVGVNGGYGFGSSNWTSAAAASTGSFNTNGFLLGGTIGANFQANQFVFGVEADLDWTTLKGSTSTPTTAGFCTGVSCQTANNWLGTVRGRLGYAFDRVLVFGTGGGAFGNIQAGRNPPTTYDTATNFGWTAGGGVEFAFSENLTGKIEYLFVDLSNGTCTTIANCGAAAAGSSVSFTANVVRAGINYKFGGF